MRAVNRLVLWVVQGAGLMGARALLGGEGVGRTRAVDMEKVLPCSAKGEAESMDTTSHFRMLPMSSCSGVYSRPFPTCSTELHLPQLEACAEAECCCQHRAVEAVNPDTDRPEGLGKPWTCISPCYATVSWIAGGTAVAPS